METQNLLENSAVARAQGLDMICANSLRDAGAGFGGDTNIVIITKDDETELGKLSIRYSNGVIDKARQLGEAIIVSF